MIKIIPGPDVTFGFGTRKVDRANKRFNRISITTKAEAAWNSMVDCSIQVRKSTIRDIPEEQVKIVGHVLEKVSQNLTACFGFDHYCTSNPITSNDPAKTPQRRKKEKL